jgi:hypothetical protein
MAWAHAISAAGALPIAGIISVSKYPTVSPLTSGNGTITTATGGLFCLRAICSERGGEAMSRSLNPSLMTANDLPACSSLSPKHQKRGHLIKARENFQFSEKVKSCISQYTAELEMSNASISRQGGKGTDDPCRPLLIARRTNASCSLPGNLGQRQVAKNPRSTH